MKRYAIDAAIALAIILAFVAPLALDIPVDLGPTHTTEAFR